MRNSFGVVLALFALASCSGGDSGGIRDGGNGGGGSGFTADIDGRPWAAESVGVTARAGGGPGLVVVVGSQTAGGITRSLSISLNYIAGPGRYPLGVGPGVFGGHASVGEGTGGGNSNRWETALSGVAGSIDVTAISSGRLVATFAYETEADKNNTVGGTRSVTNGKIDLPLMGTLPSVPDNQGSKLSAVLNGKPFNAWAVNTVLTDPTGGPGVMIDSHSSENGVDISLSAVSAPGMFTFSNQNPVRAILVGVNNGDASHCCWGLNAGNDIITVTITSLTPARVKGTFSGTLQAQPGKPATTPMMITDGSFDVGTAP